MKFIPDVRNWAFLACSIISFLVFRNSVSVAQVVVREIVEAMLFTISSSYKGEFEIDSESDFIISGQIYFRLYRYYFRYLCSFGSFYIEYFRNYEFFPLRKLMHLISWTESVCFSIKLFFDIENRMTSTDYSSVGRAGDCRGRAVISRSLVRIRLVGNLFSQ